MKLSRIRVRSLKAQLVAVATLIAFSLAFMVPPEAVAQNNPVQKARSSVLVTGQIATGGVFNGVLKVTHVAVDSATGALTAAGTLTGTLTNAAGQVIGNLTNQAVTGIPLASVSGSCTILTLTLGPLDLNLLGLMVHLNQVVLNITAQPGPGNLLGNLLCSVANLLNGGNLSNLLTQLTGLLNQILGAL
jgi:hypothetical protein